MMGPTSEMESVPSPFLILQISTNLKSVNRRLISLRVPINILVVSLITALLAVTGSTVAYSAPAQLHRSAPAQLHRSAAEHVVKFVTFPGTRPFKLQVPAVYLASKATPLIISLHGYTSSGAAQESYFKLGPVANARDILYVAPDGTLDNAGNRFWNATPACCNFYGSAVDDEAYIMSIIKTVSKSYTVDSKRIYIVGHSNGGFMAHHMACSHSDQIAAIVSFSGATFKEQSSCQPAKPVSILQIWGTSDETISYKGGALVNPYPGASETISDWVRIDKCSAIPIPLIKRIDIDRSIPGAETKVSSYMHCGDRTVVELWSIPGAPHVPPLVPNFATKIVNFLLAHPKV